MVGSAFAIEFLISSLDSGVTSDNDANVDHDAGGGASSEDKSLTFRKRRLSLTNLRQLAEAKEKQQRQQQQRVGGQNEDVNLAPFLPPKQRLV